MIYAGSIITLTFTAETASSQIGNSLFQRIESERVYNCFADGQTRAQRPSGSAGNLQRQGDRQRVSRAVLRNLWLLDPRRSRREEPLLEPHRREALRLSGLHLHGGHEGQLDFARDAVSSVD